MRPAHCGVHELRLVAAVVRPYFPVESIWKDITMKKFKNFIRSLKAAAPVPCWTEYLRTTRH